ncbi:MAG: ribonuclease H-like domain-containing protein, partial [Firmicutes bacterium]|nr:ribonuclease H-like domain-containing protein [Bacillota bacterium]
MIHTQETLKNEVVPGYAFDCYFGGRKVGILDIETTGLSPERSRVILGGLITIEPGVANEADAANAPDTILAEEFFCEYNNDRDEKELLEAYMAAIRNVDVVVTYNGEHFDIPFLRARCKKLGVEFEEGLPYNLDLYRVLKKYSEIKKALPNMKQKTVESYFGLWKTRTDMISGKDSVD